MDKKLSLKEIYSKYKIWVSHNPTHCSNMELIATWSSYYIASKLENSPIASELVYSMSRLLNLFNDSIIREAYNSVLPYSDLRYKIKLWLSVSHYCEVTVELLVRKYLGSKGRWTIVVLLQLTKSLATLYLLHKYKEIPIEHPPIKFLRRTEIAEKGDDNPNISFTLPRTGRHIRRVDGSAPPSLRDWQPIKVNADIPYSTIKDMYYAETIHVLRPLIHLAAMRVFGVRSWQQWILSLGLDLSSLKLYEKYVNQLSNYQKQELNSRKLALLLYLIRNPMYHKYMSRVIKNVLGTVSNAVPLTSFVCNPLLRYVSNLQDAYFHLWSS